VSSNEQYIPHKLSQFEKATTGIVATLMTSLLIWVGVSVNEQKIQQTATQERLIALSVIVIKVQKGIEDAVPARNALITANALLNQRVGSLEKEVSTMKIDINTLESGH